MNIHTEEYDFEEITTKSLIAETITNIDVLGSALESGKAIILGNRYGDTASEKAVGEVVRKIKEVIWCSKVQGQPSPSAMTGPRCG